MTLSTWLDRKIIDTIYSSNHQVYSTYSFIYFSLCTSLIIFPQKLSKLIWLVTSTSLDHARCQYSRSPLGLIFLLVSSRGVESQQVKACIKKET